MTSPKLEALIEKEAFDRFDATKETFLVVEDDALEDDSGSVVVRCFADHNAAVRCARALAHGNVNHRVLRVSGQVLVVATRNEL